MTGREVTPAAQACIDECCDLLRMPDAEAELREHYAGLPKRIDPATATPARDDENPIRPEGHDQEQDR